MKSIKNLPQTKAKMRVRKDGIKQRYWCGKHPKVLDKHYDWRNKGYKELKDAGWKGRKFTDSDGDGKVNTFDCRPLDSGRQDNANFMGRRKTLSDLKRDLKSGMHVVMKENSGVVKNEIREVVKVQTNEISFRRPDGVVTYLRIPKVSLLDYDGKTIIIYEPGERNLTSEEISVINGEPRDDEQLKRDVMSDGSTMLRREKRYYESKGMAYLMPSTFDKGKRTRRTNDGLKVVDDDIKGKVSLIYEII